MKTRCLCFFLLRMVPCWSTRACRKSCRCNHPRCHPWTLVLYPKNQVVTRGRRACQVLPKAWRGNFPARNVAGLCGGIWGGAFTHADVSGCVTNRDFVYQLCVAFLLMRLFERQVLDQKLVWSKTQKGGGDFQFFVQKGQILRQPPTKCHVCGSRN